LGNLTDELSQSVGLTYSEGEEELLKITAQLQSIDTSSDFFEAEKRRMKDEREAERARDIGEALAVGEEVADKDLKWLKKHQDQLAGASFRARARTGDGPLNLRRAKRGEEGAGQSSTLRLFALPPSLYRTFS